MIKINELMIGNYVYNSKNEIKKISIGDLSVMSVNEIIGNEDEIFKPIPLTIEVLNNIINFDGFMAIKKDNWFEIEIIIDNENISKIYKKIKYLHEFQNIYKCLTNKELEINVT